MADFDIEAMLAAQTERRERNRAQAEEEAQDPLGRHKWVVLDGLKAAELNDKMAEIVVPANENDRFGVRVRGEEAVKLIKRCNLVTFSEQDTIKVCRLSAKGEKTFIGGYIQDTRWPRTVLESMPFEVSRVSELLGFPLRITRVQARSKLSDGSHYDNQWATWMAIDPESGFAPHQWQSGVGPCVIWRPDGDVSSCDMCLFNDFLSDLLDKYERGVEPSRDITPGVWARKKEALLGLREGDPNMEPYRDINI